MNVNEYQMRTSDTEIHSKAALDFIARIQAQADLASNGSLAAKEFLQLMYCAGKLSGEAGEIDEKVFKAFRDSTGKITPELREGLFKEVGDILWYAAQISTICKFSLEDVMDYNLTKLSSRKERGVLSGSGDNR